MIIRVQVMAKDQRYPYVLVEQKGPYCHKWIGHDVLRATPTQGVGLEVKDLEVAAVDAIMSATHRSEFIILDVYEVRT
jgi:hypothetical protein